MELPIAILAGMAVAEVAWILYRVSRAIRRFEAMQQALYRDQVEILERQNELIDMLILAVGDSTAKRNELDVQ